MSITSALIQTANTTDKHKTQKIEKCVRTKFSINWKIVNE